METEVRNTVAEGYKVTATDMQHRTYMQITVLHELTEALNKRAEAGDTRFTREEMALMDETIAHLAIFWKAYKASLCVLHRLDPCKEDCCADTSCGTIQ